MDGWMDGWMCGWMDECMMDGWMDGRMDGLMDGWFDKYRQPVGNSISFPFHISSKNSFEILLKKKIYNISKHLRANVGKECVFIELSQVMQLVMIFFYC